MKTSDDHSASQLPETGCIYNVEGNHPILGRPDKHGLTFSEAVAYSEELVKAGYEGVVIREVISPVSVTSQTQAVVGASAVGEKTFGEICAEKMAEDFKLNHSVSWTEIAALIDKLDKGRLAALEADKERLEKG